MHKPEDLFAESKKYISGGVNSPVRSFDSVGGTPIFIEKAEGAYLIDHQNKKYIDYVGSWGPMIMGHNHPKIVQKVKNAIDKGMSFGAPTQIETLLAKKISAIMPSIELIRMVNSGTEAAMSAIRLARGFTKRSTIVKFEGCYHGHADSLLVKAGSGVVGLNESSSAGVPKELVQHTISLPYNDIESLKNIFIQKPNEIACVIVEPVAGNMNCILPIPGFLKILRKLCTENGALLIFDEVMTGFRVTLGGAQDYFKITPDLTVLGKVIGAGMPVGAFGGRRNIMEQLAPLGDVYQAGTLSGNPVAMTAGLANLELLIENSNLYKQLESHLAYMLNELKCLADKYEIPFASQYIGGMFGLFFAARTPVNFDQATFCNNSNFKTFFHSMLKQGVYFAPSPFEAGFISYAHKDADIDFTIKCAKNAFKELIK